jgi:hypothetical protein
MSVANLSNGENAAALAIESRRRLVPQHDASSVARARERARRFCKRRRLAADDRLL